MKELIIKKGDKQITVADKEDVIDALDNKVSTSDTRLTDVRNPKVNRINNASSSNIIDLNNYNTAGFYFNGNNTDTYYIKNCPWSMVGNAPYSKNKAFFLLVETWGQSSNSWVKQTLTYYFPNSITYIRVCNSGTWQPWKEVTLNGMEEIINSTQAEGSSAWTGTSSRIITLTTGTRINYWLKTTSGTDSITLDLTLANGDTTGAKNVSPPYLAKRLPAYIMVELIWDGYNWFIVNPTNVVNDLTTGGTSNALSAEQGKTLKSLVDSKITNGTGTVTSTNIADKTIVNADIADNAAIAYSKLSGVVASTDNRLTDKRKPYNNSIGANSNLNNFTDAGFYYCQGDAEVAPTIVNQPLTSGSQRSFSMIVELISSQRVVQKLTYYSTKNTYIRTNINGEWSTWNCVLHSGNYSNYANKTTVDTALSSTSTNPVQNKVINTALGNKVDKVSGKGLSTNDFTNDLKTKLDGIATGANKTTVDSALSSTSTNPVQNKVINTALGGKAATSHTHGNIANNGNVELITSTQTTSTNAWTGTSSTIASISKGTRIYYMLTKAPTTSGVTLNLTLSNGSTTGAKQVIYNGVQLTNQIAHWNIIEMMYDGSNWFVINPSRVSGDVACTVTDINGNTSTINLVTR